MATVGPIGYRMMTLDDVARIPISCQGSVLEIEARIRDLGGAAVLGFDRDQHVAQLQFRRYARDLRSPRGLWDPAYWGDFGEQAPRLSEKTLSVFCYHVGQLDETERRETQYQGRGIGLQLLDYLVSWATDSGFEYIVAKATPADRRVMSFMGGQPVSAYLQRGFDVAASWIDQQLREVVGEKSLVSPDESLDDAARISCCVKRLDVSTVGGREHGVRTFNG